MKKVLIFRVFLFLIIGFLLIPIFISKYDNSPTDSCTTFTISKGNKAFFAHNEDYSLSHARAWFYPPSEGKFGRVLFGYAVELNLDIPVSGMNDQGLCVATDTVPDTTIKDDPEKEDYIGSFVHELLEKCSTVIEVIEWAKQYDLTNLEFLQVHVADKTGAAIVLGLDVSGELKITRKSGDFLISTNFNVAQPRICRERNTACSRYDTAENMLKGIKDPSDLTINYLRSILSATHQRGTLYSHIMDLKSCRIYIYSHADYENVGLIDLNKEILKGERSYEISLLVSLNTNQIPDTIIIGNIISICITICALIGCVIIIKKF